MSLFRPYHIEHILLDKSLPVSLPHKDIGHYYVFWWKCIPLGQLFMEPGALVEESELRKKVVESIEPAIAFYSANNKSFVAALHNYFIEKDQERFEKEMARLLSPFTEATVPEQADVSLVICTRNRAAYLKDCLYSLRSLSCLPKEIIVVDNAPSDNSTKAVADLFPEVIYHSW